MNKPTNCREKREYKRIVYLDLDRLIYLDENTDPFTYLEDYPNNRIIPVYTVIDNTVVSGTGMEPEDFPILTKKGNQIYKFKINQERKKIEVEDFNGVNTEIKNQAVISQSFTGGSESFLYTKSSNYSVVSTLIFKGSELLDVPDSITCLVGQTSSEASIRIYDSTNNKIITEKAFTNKNPSLLEFDNINNIPEETSIWEIQMKRVSGRGNQVVRLYSIDIYF